MVRRGGCIVKTSIAGTVRLMEICNLIYILMQRKFGHSQPEVLDEQRNAMLLLNFDKPLSPRLNDATRNLRAGTTFETCGR